jgi:ACR3 family arsenite efflux pump ArsB
LFTDLIGLTISAAGNSAPAISALTVLLSEYGETAPQQSDAVSLISSSNHSQLLIPLAEPIFGALQKYLGVVDSVLEFHAL